MDRGDRRHIHDIVHRTAAGEIVDWLGQPLDDWPDRFGALVGDLVTFTLKYTNSGGQPITHVVISDSLTNRLEYVPGTAKTDREAIFTTQPNDAGSQVLRWEITGTLQPRETGIVTFQVRVR